MLSWCIYAVLAIAASAQAPGVAQGGAPCVNDWNCSLSGVCNASAVCECDQWATGPRCDLLNLAPANPNAGLQVPGYFSWGGHALPDAGTFHLFASFMCRHATLGDWTTKSSIWRATAATPDGPFVLADMIAQPWSHNAMLASTAGDPTAPRFVLYQIGDAVTDPSEWQPCYNASEANSARPSAASRGSTVAGPRVRDSDRDGYSVYVRSAPALAGPWTENGTPIEFVFPPGGWSTSVNGGNPAPFFFENGTVLMYYSANPCPPNWGNISPGNNCIGVARGDSWRGPFTALPLPVTHPESEDAAVSPLSPNEHRTRVTRRITHTRHAGLPRQARELPPANEREQRPHALRTGRAVRRPRLVHGRPNVLKPHDRRVRPDHPLRERQLLADGVRRAASGAPARVADGPRGPGPPRRQQHNIGVALQQDGVWCTTSSVCAPSSGAPSRRRHPRGLLRRHGPLVLRGFDHVGPAVLLPWAARLRPDHRTACGAYLAIPAQRRGGYQLTRLVPDRWLVSA
jgi:hypothetical protein